MPENIIQIDQHMLETRLDRLVTQKVTEILNAMLDAEADEIAEVLFCLALVLFRWDFP